LRPTTAEFAVEIGTVGVLTGGSTMIVLVAKALVFLWATQLIWIGSNLLEVNVNKVSGLASPKVVF
jgi:hypothetical protein